MIKVKRYPFFRYVVFQLFTLLTYVNVFFDSHAESKMATRDITLNGSANGGILSLSQVLQVGAGFVSVVTTQGESAEVVLNRLAEEICRTDPFNWHSNPQYLRQIISVTGNNLTLPDSGLRYAFSGTDKGFLIRPVLSVSGSYNPNNKQVRLFWINPPDHYDTIHVGSLTFSSQATNCVYEMPVNTLGIWGSAILGKRGNTFSPPASIIISTNSQEELDTFPFYMGIAPNWSSWSVGTNADVFRCEQGIKPDADMRVRGDPWDKPLYQIIKTTQKGAQGGVWRRFLGLKPRHTYKIEVRLNTLEMDACTNEWTFSFHAAYDNPNGSGLTTDQLAGTATLPDGSNGLDAGRVALYGAGVTTKGKWVKRSTNEAVSGLKSKSITLPEDVTSITVWLRHSGDNSTGVGMDWIKVEDVTK